MTKLFILTIFVLTTIFANAISLSAQTADSNDSSVLKGYAGVLYIGSCNGKNYDNDPLYSWHNTGTWRFGFNFSAVSHNSKIVAWAAVQDNCYIPNVYFQQTIDFCDIAAGYLSRPITWQRPHPVSAASHFEPVAVSKIPGSAPGVLAKFNYSAGGKLAVGVFDYQASGSNLIDYSLNWEQKINDWSIQLGGRLNNLTSGVACTFKSANISFTNYMDNDSLLATFLNLDLNLVGLTWGQFYFDGVYNYDQDNYQERLEVGWTKYLYESEFIGQTTHFMIGLGYQVQPISQLRVYGFCHF